MAKSGISKLEAAQRQLDCAIRFYGKEDSLAVHTLAFASFRLLFDLCPNQHAIRVALENIIETMEWSKFTRVPNFLKHADRDPEGLLDDHSEESVYITIVFATLLYVANGGHETPDMLSFLERDDPFEKGYRLNKVVEYFREHREERRFRQPGPISEQDEALLKAELGPILITAST
jgi:hypothetical protein